MEGLSAGRADGQRRFGGTGSGSSRIALLLGRSRVRGHDRGESESIYRRRKLAWVDTVAEGGTSMDPAAAEGQGEGRPRRDRAGDVGEYRQMVDDRLDRMDDRLDRMEERLERLKDAALSSSILPKLRGRGVTALALACV